MVSIGTDKRSRLYHVTLKGDLLMPPLREMRRGADAGNAGSYARDNRFIIWTGHSYNDKPESGRS
ncbi:hypothetical protein ACFQS7_29710, partial [Dankookia sp. GCM10030260]|uniref:hypothetical protein n=1 Tax=Dankookia sp. GCM10030260 TaxID=3273390 RepID=UPI00361E3116